jgi:hypothetical protein
MLTPRVTTVKRSLMGWLTDLRVSCAAHIPRSSEIGVRVSFTRLLERSIASRSAAGLRLPKAPRRRQRRRSGTSSFGVSAGAPERPRADAAAPKLDRTAQSALGRARCPRHEPIVQSLRRNR